MFGNSISSKHPMRDVTRHTYGSSRYSGETRGLMGATIKHPHLGEFRIYNTHLDVWDQSETTRLSQVKQIDALIKRDLEQYRFDGPVILFGDFNALHPSSYVDPLHWEWILKQDEARKVQTKTSAMSFLINSGWADLAQPSPPPVTTWSMRRIDYVLMRTEMAHLLEGYRIRLWHHLDTASDHLPIGMDLTLREQL